MRSSVSAGMRHCSCPTVTSTPFCTSIVTTGDSSRSEPDTSCPVWSKYWARADLPIPPIPTMQMRDGIRVIMNHAQLMATILAQQKKLHLRSEESAEKTQIRFRRAEGRRDEP